MKAEKLTSLNCGYHDQYGVGLSMYWLVLVLKVISQKSRFREKIHFHSVQTALEITTMCNAWESLIKYDLKKNFVSKYEIL